jgi:hypothetical protein
MTKDAAKASALLAGIVAALALPAKAATTTIDFESTPVGIYSFLSFGTATITFTGGTGTFNVDNQTPGPPVSGHNLISYFQNSGSAPFNVSFSSLINSFTIGSGDFNADDDDVHLTAFDSANNIVDSASYINPPSTFGGSFLTVTGPNISYVQFYETGSFAGAIYWDNITFSDQPSVSVPEPGTVALLSISLAGLGLIRRRKKT